MNNNDFMMRAIQISNQMIDSNQGGPFGCVIVKDGLIIAEGWNKVTGTKDPTAHGEIVAIREACKTLDTHQLTGCELYTSSEPCPMCMAAIYWARLDKVYYGNTRHDAAVIGFDDSVIYDELKLDIQHRKVPMEQLLASEALSAFEKWNLKKDKVMY